jgi:hypothetical protein
MFGFHHEADHHPQSQGAVEQSLTAVGLASISKYQQGA